MAASPVYLVQSDTTVGLASEDAQVLNRLKGRPEDQPCLQTLGSLKELNRSVRVPKFARKTVRRAKHRTYIYHDGQARRVVFDGAYEAFLRPFGQLFSTSANISGQDFDEAWAREAADVIVTTPEGFSQRSASSIYRLHKDGATQIR